MKKKCHKKNTETLLGKLVDKSVRKVEIPYIAIEKNKNCAVSLNVKHK